MTSRTFGGAGGTVQRETRVRRSDQVFADTHFNSGKQRAVNTSTFHLLADSARCEGCIRLWPSFDKAFPSRLPRKATVPCGMVTAPSTPSKMVQQRRLYTAPGTSYSLRLDGRPAVSFSNRRCNLRSRRLRCHGGWSLRCGCWGVALGLQGRGKKVVRIRRITWQKIQLTRRGPYCCDKASTHTCT